MVPSFGSSEGGGSNNKKEYKKRKKKETSVVGRCVFDRTASMNNKIFHSFLFFVCVCVDDTCMCECKHIDGSVDRPGALSLFAVPSFTSPPTTTTTTTGTATVYIRRCVCSYASVAGGVGCGRQLADKMARHVRFIFVMLCLYRLGPAWLPSIGPLSSKLF